MQYATPVFFMELTESIVNFDNQIVRYFHKKATSVILTRNIGRLENWSLYMIINVKLVLFTNNKTSHLQNMVQPTYRGWGKLYPICNLILNQKYFIPFYFIQRDVLTQRRMLSLTVIPEVGRNIKLIQSIILGSEGGCVYFSFPVFWLFCHVDYPG